MDKSVQSLLKKEEGKSTRKANLIAYLFLAPYLIAFIVFFVIPLGWGIITSLYKYNPYDPSVMEFVGLKNYEKILFGFKTNNYYSTTFWNAFGTTVLFDLVAIPCLILFPLGIAYLINLKPVGYNIFRAIIYLPSIISVATMGAIFGAMFGNTQYGFINALFKTNTKFLDEPMLRWMVILLASIWWQSGQNFIIFSAALRDVDKTLYEASSIDGCNKWKQFIYVTLPGIKNQMIICLFTTIIGYLNLYGQPMVICSAINKGDIESPMMLIQQTISDPETYRLTGLMTATAFIFGFIILLISGIQMLLTGERKGGNKHEKRFKECVGTQD